MYAIRSYYANKGAHAKLRQFFDRYGRRGPAYAGRADHQGVTIELTQPAGEFPVAGKQPAVCQRGNYPCHPARIASYNFV